MKHLKKFNTEEEYNTFLNSEECVSPNVSLVGFGSIKYNPIQQPLYFDAIDDITVTMSNLGTKVYYNVNGAWETLTSEVTIPANSRVYFKSTNHHEYASSSSRKHRSFIVNGRFNVGGNIMSLIHLDDYKGKDELINQEGFYNLFRNCTTLISAKELILPNKLRNDCFNSMFRECTSLKVAPDLLATTMTSKQYSTNTTGTWGCYENMFANCTSLVKPPKIKATTLAKACFFGMFKGCTSLTTIPNISSPIESQSCYEMFKGCTSLKEVTISSPSVASNGCYEMFKDCTSLTSAILLPTTANEYQAYYSLFYGCKNLNYIKDLSISSDSRAWVTGVSQKGTFVQHYSRNRSTGTDYIPSGWTVKLYDPDTDKYVIKFKIGSTSYIAEENATWADWVASSYNTAGFTISGTNVLSADGVTVTLSGTAVVSTDAITSNGSYTI